MDIGGWLFDVRALYGRSWRKRARSDLGEWLWEAPNGTSALLFFALGEVDMNRQIGRIAVLRRRGDPTCVVLGRRLFWFEGHGSEPARCDPARNLALVDEVVRRWWSRSFGSRPRAIDLTAARLLPLGGAVAPARDPQ